MPQRADPLHRETKERERERERETALETERKKRREEKIAKRSLDKMERERIRDEKGHRGFSLVRRRVLFYDSLPGRSGLGKKNRLVIRNQVGTGLFLLLKGSCLILVSDYNSFDVSWHLASVYRSWNLAP